MSKATTTSVCFEAEAIRNAREYAGDAARRVKEKNKQIEAQDTEITRLRTAINDALTAPFPDSELNSTWHQEPIGPNETPEEAIKRLVSVRAEWAVHKNNCENPVIAELRAALATARREGMKNAAKWHEVRSMELSGKAGLARNFRQLLRQSDFHMESAAAIRAAAGEVKP